LSYTDFAYHAIRLSETELEPGESLSIEVDLRNVGTRAGAEVVQLYVRDPVSTLARPEKELKAFARVDLERGATGTASMSLDMRSLAYFDDLRNAWVADAGRFGILVGSSSKDIKCRASFELNSEWVEAVADTWRSPMT
jgi:beta-glucosidase